MTMYTKLIKVREELANLENTIIEQISSISTFTEDEYYTTQKIVTLFPDKTIITIRENKIGDNGEDIWSIDGHEFCGNEADLLIEIFEHYNRNEI